MSSNQGGEAKRPKVEKNEYTEAHEASVEGWFDGGSNPTLPNKLVLDQILTRLPAKFLIQCTCVCRCWYTTILNDPEFASSHFLQYSQKNPSLLYAFGGQGEIKSFYLSLGGKEKESGGAFVDLDKLETIGSEHKKELLIGSCNGLVCLFNLDDQIIEVYNPTRHQKLSIFPNHPINCIRFGFGYDSLSKEYKVVLFSLELSHCMVFSFGKNSYWREITIDEDVVSRLFDDSETEAAATFCNGTLYWRRDKELVSFDLDKEKFEVISFTPEPFKGFSLRLLVHKGSLCRAYVSSDCRGGALKWYVNLFVLVDEGSSKQVWKKESFLLPRVPPGSNIQLVDFLDRLLLHRTILKGEIRIFNVHTRKSKEAKIPDNLDHWVVSSHVENLLSLPTGQHMMGNVSGLF